MCHVVQRDSSAIKFDTSWNRIYLSFYFTGWTNNRWRRGGNQSTQKKTVATSFRKWHHSTLKGPHVLSHTSAMVFTRSHAAHFKTYLISLVNKVRNTVTACNNSAGCRSSTKHKVRNQNCHVDKTVSEMRCNTWCKDQLIRCAGKLPITHVGMSLVWALNSTAAVCGLFLSSLSGGFSGYSGMLPSFIGLRFKLIIKLKIIQIHLSKLTAELSFLIT